MVGDVAKFLRRVQFPAILEHEGKAIDLYFMPPRCEFSGELY